MEIQPYLFFHGRCEEAVEFYRRALGAQGVELMRFKDMPPTPGASIPPGSESKIMHGMFRVGASTVLVSDGDGPSSGFQGFSLAAQVTSEAEADRVFAALAQGGKVTMPLGKTFWSPRFGIVADKFGVTWMVNTNTTAA